MFPGDLTIDVLAAAMRGALRRNEVLANNLANADTPGYRRLDVSFEAELAEALQEDRHRAAGRVAASFGDGSAVAAQQAAVSRVTGTVMRIDGANVDPDDELAQLSANQLAYQTVVSLLDKKFGLIRSAITGN